MTTAVSVLSDQEWATWREHGYVLRRGFASQELCDRMLAEAIDICRRRAAGERVKAYVAMEKQPNPHAANPEDHVSKVFKLHRNGAFGEFATDPAVVDLVAALLGPEVDCFLSQFIFKTPGAMGQPWHQDSYYFPFTPDHQLGVWLSVTEATLENGCLHILPGSHTEPVHKHVLPKRPNSNDGYVEIVDHDMGAEIPVLMKPGDLLLFDSHVMHCSTDNVSDGIRAAMVYHYSPAGTIDRTPENPFRLNDWMPVRRAAEELTP